MTMIVIINPIFAMIVERHWLNVIEAFPFTINVEISCVGFNLIDHPMGAIIFVVYQSSF